MPDEKSGPEILFEVLRRGQAESPGLGVLRRQISAFQPFRYSYWMVEGFISRPRIPYRTSYDL